MAEYIQREDINHFIIPITNVETKAVIKNLQTKKSTGLEGLIPEFYQTFKG
jgi:hypothetical protein